MEAHPRLESLRSRYSKLQDTDTRQLTGVNMAAACRSRPLSGWNITRRRISSGKSKMRSPTGPNSISSCFTRRCRALHFLRRCRSREECSRVSTWPTSRGSTNSTSSTPPYRATIPNGFSIAPSGATLRRMEPSLYRMCRTLLREWQRYKDYPDAGVRERFRARDREIANGLHSSAAGNGKTISRFERDRESGHSCPAHRSCKGIWQRSCCRGGGRAVAAVDEPARGKTPAGRADMRASDVYRAAELGRGFGINLGEDQSMPWA